MKEILKALLDRINGMRKVESTGFANEKDAAEYLREREAVIAEVVKTISDLNDAYDTELQALKTQLGEAMKTFKEKPVIRELSKEEMKAELGRFIRAVWRKNAQVIGEAGGLPNRERSEEWTDERSVMFDKASGRFVSKTALGSPLGGGTDGQYVMPTQYERELIRYATEWSDMMNFVRTLPMNVNTISWPTLNRYSTALAWLSATGDAISEAGKPSFGARVELSCKTLAGYIPWYDEFEEDVQINVSLGSIFLEMFAEAYAVEFDNQVLNATTPFKGIFQYTAVGECIRKYVSGGSPTSVTLDDLRAMPYAIPRADRDGGMFILSEDMVSLLISLRNAMGDFLIQPPNSNDRPGRIVGFPYIEAKRAPAIGDITTGEPFVWFGNPKRNLWHGDRKGIEIRTFDQTTESLLHGEQFLRFRKRDAFKVVQPDLSVLLCVR